MPPVITIDLYGNVFIDGQNSNSQIADFARNHPELAPQVDGAVRDFIAKYSALADAQAQAAATTAALIASATTTAPAGTP